MLRIVLVPIVVSVLVITSVATSLAIQPLRVFLNDVQIAFPDQLPVIESERTLVPARFVSEALGADVTWNGATQSVTVVQEEKTIVLVIGQRNVAVDGRTVSLDVPARIINSRTMVPLRFVSEVLGAQVEWRADEYAVYITTETKSVEQPPVIEIKETGVAELVWTGTAFEERVIQDFDSFIRGTAKPVFVNFYHVWPDPDTSADRFVETLPKLFDGKGHIVRVNTHSDYGQALALQYTVISLPTFLIFKNGTTVERMHYSKAREQLIIETIESHVNAG